MNYFLL
jgi:hypothetical protein